MRTTRYTESQILSILKEYEGGTKKGSETWGTPFNWSTVLGEDNFSETNTVSIFPNPATDFINVNLGSSQNSFIPIRVTDPFGRIVKQTLVSPGTKKISLDVHDLSSGIYFVSILFSRKTITQKFVK